MAGKKPKDDRPKYTDSEKKNATKEIRQLKSVGKTDKDIAAEVGLPETVVRLLNEEGPGA